MSAAPYLAAAAIFVLGIYGAIVARHVVQQILCVSVAQSGTYVLLLALGFRFGAGPPVFNTAPPSRVLGVDPLVQALALTDVVVSAATTALLLAIVMQIAKRGGTTRPDTQHADADGGS